MRHDRRDELDQLLADGDEPLAGVLAALQTMSILVALPFSIVMVLMVVATTKALLAEHRWYQKRRRQWFAQQVAEEVTEELRKDPSVPTKG